MAKEPTVLDRLIETLAQLRFTENHLGGIEVDWAGSDNREYWRDEARRELAGVDEGFTRIVVNPSPLSDQETAEVAVRRALRERQDIPAWIEWVLHYDTRMKLYAALAKYDPLDPPTPEQVGLGGVIHTMELVVCRQCWHDADRRAELTPAGFATIWWCPRCKIKL